MDDIMRAGDFSIVEDFAKIHDMPYDFNRIVKHAESAKYDMFDPSDRLIEAWKDIYGNQGEVLMNHFAAWIKSPELRPAAEVKFFEKWFPKKMGSISPEKAAETRAALDVWEQETKAIHAARQMSNDIFKRHEAALKGAKRGDKFWAAVKADWDKMWESYEDIHSGLLAKRYRVSPGAIPPPQKIADELTPAHVAYILGGTDDSLVAAMMRGESHLLRSKTDFVSHVRAQAKIVADKAGKSVDDIGFTDEAVSNVYDRL
ncbi:unnamed protein product, partial [marine sediment metagenome]